ncbi:transcriptional regulator, LacI family [Catenulispora acidiphila DSM 44928]|uniref:Transcriptional regulator, LacI family n=1 Tax=Catenulispora acidiphila (strain DSM 44928 / JCM 14897 / NBRC 102108 / NRRL B-24433 / ID139908) TaxID=479433 RepID=C7Q3H7_CATAD|nr:LacI family DNA-binding transcriptional regulator [Catenulispora acidiphila]ACU75742.1 transcriptional regulator, LacI family [Catenulispora acidiphila DSM 44928]
MATMNDVAALAGVSPSTVSYVMTGKRPIGEATRRKVLAAAKELNWEPNSRARALRSSHSNTLALVGPARTHAYAEVQGALVYALAQAAEDQGYDLLLKTTGAEPKDMVSLARSSVADAVILTDVLLEDPRVEKLRTLSFPMVLVGRPTESQHLNWVDLDFFGAGRATVDRLADLGHRVIAFFGPPPSAYKLQAGYAVRTLEGAREAALRRGVRLVAPPTTESLDGFADEVESAFRSAPEVTGVILQYEPATALIPQILAGLGRSIPDDVSIIAIAPSQLAMHARPPIDYVELQLTQMAQYAVRFAVDSIEGADPQSVLLPAEITNLGSVRQLSR